MEWIKNNKNYVIGTEDFYISYNPNTADGHNELTKLANIIALSSGINKKFTDGEETAICRKNGKSGGKTLFLILKGDFRKEYEEVFDKGYQACLEVYNKYKKEHASTWSDI